MFALFFVICLFVIPKLVEISAGAILTSSCTFCFHPSHIPGHPYGPEASVPNHGGWVRVQWPVTGFQKSYRLGSMGSTRCHDLKYASAAKIQASSLENVSKGMLKLHHLRCDFGYRGGTKHSHYAKFDIREEACLKVAGFVHGDVVEDTTASGRRSTCIGLKYNAEKKKVAGHCFGVTLLYVRYRNVDGLHMPWYFTRAIHTMLTSNSCRGVGCL